jgi:hypothetical protein
MDELRYAENITVGKLRNTNIKCSLEKDKGR